MLYFETLIVTTFTFVKQRDDSKRIRVLMNETLNSNDFIDPNEIILGNTLITNACILDDNDMVTKVFNISRATGIAIDYSLVRVHHLPKLRNIVIL